MPGIRKRVTNFKPRIPLYQATLLRFDKSLKLTLCEDELTVFKLDISHKLHVPEEKFHLQHETYYKNATF